MATIATRRPRRRREAPAARVTDGAAPRVALAAGLVVIAVGLAAVAVLGPLFTGVVDYRVTETLRNQTLGLDAVSLFLVAPLALVAAALVARAHVLGPALALGIGAYTSYMLLQYVLGPDYGSLPGNNERAFLLHLVVFAAGWMVALAAWNAIEADRLPRSRRRDLLVGRVLLPVLGLLAFVRYLPALRDAMSATPTDAGYLAGPSFFWTIALLDLGVFLPATVVTCAGLLREAPWARKALFAVAGWFALVGPAVAAMAIAMYLNDDPNTTLGTAVFMTALGAAFALLAASLYRPLLRAGGAAPTTVART